MPSLRLTYRPEDEWHGELTAAVESEGFAGRGSAWFNRADIDAFLMQIEPCPIDGAPRLAGGTFDAGVLVQETLGLRIMVHDALGNLRVDVRVSTGAIHVGRGEPKQCLAACFMTNYAQLAGFRTALASLLAAGDGQADLLGR